MYDKLTVCDSLYYLRTTKIYSGFFKVQQLKHMKMAGYTYDEDWSHAPHAKEVCRKMRAVNTKCRKLANNNTGETDEEISKLYDKLIICDSLYYLRTTNIYSGLIKVKQLKDMKIAGYTYDEDWSHIPHAKEVCSKMRAVNTKCRKLAKNNNDVISAGLLKDTLTHGNHE